MSHDKTTNVTGLEHLSHDEFLILLAATADELRARDRALAAAWPWGGRPAKAPRRARGAQLAQEAGAHPETVAAIAALSDGALAQRVGRRLQERAA